MEKIKSFKVDHNILEPGIFCADLRHNVTIYDLRFYKPNTKYIPIKAMHTIEHLFATWLKICFDYSDNIISFCPGACQTMFYLELYKCFDIDIINVVIKCIDWCLKQNKIPGASKKECGNYKSHDLKRAKTELLRFKNILIEKYL